jgi:tRNA1Val (adenine37-N6)-methyltransferase
VSGGVEAPTRDSIGRGRLVLYQPRRGYRFNVDSVILAGFASPPGRRVCDLGTGVGIVGLWLAGEGASVTGVEIQPALAALARQNAEENGLAGRFEVVVGDLRTYAPPADGPRFDQIVSNPPFAPHGRGKVDADPVRAMARHELAMRLVDLFAAAGRLLGPRGRIDVIHRADREGELLEAARAHGLWPLRLRRVVSRPGERPTRVLFEARRPAGAGAAEDTAPELIVDPDLVVHTEGGGYAPEVARLLGDAEPVPPPGA